MPLPCLNKSRCSTFPVRILLGLTALGRSRLLLVRYRITYRAVLQSGLVVNHISVRTPAFSSARMIHLWVRGDQDDGIGSPHVDACARRTIGRRCSRWACPQLAWELSVAMRKSPVAAG